MSRTIQTLTLLATLCTGAAFAQHVYVQTAAGVTVFKTDMAKVGSYTVDGTLVGTNGKYLITVDNTPGAPHLYSYEVSSSGVVGKEVSSYGLLNWSWWGGTAELSPNGENVYVSTIRGDYSLLNFSLSSTGKLAFQGIAANINDSPLPAIIGNGKFAYGFYNYCGSGGNGCDCGSPDEFVALARESNGSLEGIAFSETDPIASGLGNQYYPDGVITNDATNHLAVVVNVFNDGCEAPPYVNQLASYTVGSQGDLVSTNTWEDMPAVTFSNTAIWPAPMTINPAGNVLALAIGTGTQFFHFNGAKPITEFTGIVGTSGYIVSYAWNGDTLYAVNGASGKLHVYDVSTSKVVEAKGSPYSLGALAVFVK